MKQLPSSIAGSALCLLLASASSSAQVEDPSSKPTPLFEQTLQVKEILVEVVVTDSSGVPVIGLGKQDFRVHLRGRPVELESVSYHPWGTRPSASADRAQADNPSRKLEISPLPTSYRHFILLFHDLIFLNDKSTLGLLSQRMRAGRGVRSWVDEEMQEGDRVALASYDSRLHLYQDFTTNREKILASLELVLRRTPEEPTVPAEGQPVSLARYLPTGRELIDASTDFKEALRLLAEAAGHTPGRKHLLLFTIGTDLGGNESRALFDSPWRPSTLELLQHHEMIVYPLDLTPLGVDHVLWGGLVDLAENTGGIYFSQLRDFHKPLRTISNVLGGYYLLAFTADWLPNDGQALGLDILSDNPKHKLSYRKAVLTSRSP